MLKVLIIEDEIPARKKLKRFLGEVEGEPQVVAEIATVEEAIAFLQTTSVDVILSDIELLDGNAFEIYQQVPVSCPIIFTTAYDRFWMEAFESNGIEYLLKPFSRERFQKAWNKFLLLRKAQPSPVHADLMEKLQNILGQSAPPNVFKKRFTINTLHGMYFVETEAIALFEAGEGLIFAHEASGKRHLLSESTLKELENRLDPADFFRINRSELISKKHLEKVERYSKNALAIKIKGQEKFLITSQSHTAAFREWVES